MVKKMIYDNGRKNWEDVYSQSHNDTVNDSETGLIENIPKNIQIFILQTAKCRVVGVHPDGHCLRRALGKNHNLHPGQIIQYMRNKCHKMIQQNKKMKVESSEEWYETMKNRSVKWNNIKSTCNEPETCPAERWGGINEIQLWAMIIQQRVIVQRPTLFLLPRLRLGAHHGSVDLRSLSASRIRRAGPPDHTTGALCL